MSNYTNNYQLLIQKLDEFIRKFYANKIIKGTLYTITLILAIYLIASVSEYYLYFSSAVRTILLVGFLITSLTAIYFWILSPFLHYFRLGKIISHEQAASIIGKHFTEVSDRLLNILQLKKQSDSLENKALIEASISQKIEKLKPVPFTTAVDYSENKKYLKFAIIPVLCFLFLLFSAPNILRESNTRLLYSNTRFEKAAPFQFNLLNKNLNAVQHEDFELVLNVEGDVLPNEVVAVTDNQTFKLVKKDQNTFIYTFKKLQKDIDFYFLANGFNSKDYKIAVLPKPSIVGFEARLEYPSYLGKTNETFRNVGDMVVPAGTKITWTFNTKNTNQVRLLMEDTTFTANRSTKESFKFNKRLLKDTPYKIFIDNDYIKNADSIGYLVNVIPDKHPSIFVEKFEDSTNRKFLYFLGDASDDYGLRNISFNYRHIKKGEGESKEYKSIPVRNASGERNSKFTYAWDLNELTISPGDKISFFFMVWDNDGVYGSKYSKTPVMAYEMPTIDELKEMTEQKNEQIKDELSKNVLEAQKLNQEIKSLQEKLLQKKELNWEDKQSIQKLLEKQKQLQENVKGTKDKFNQNLEQQSDYKKSEERIQEKQKQLQKLFDEMLSEEMQKMMEEMEKLLEKLNQEQTLEELENFEMNNDQLEKELDRMLELFKQLELEQKMTETIDELNKLAEEQEDLKEETENNKSDKEELSKKQEEINEKFEDIKKDLEDIDKKNEELNNSPMEDSEEMQKDIQENLEKSLNQLQQNQNKKAGQNQQKASDKMKDMAQKMSSAMQSAQMQQMMENMRALQQLLDNLIKLSFDQEQLIEDIKLQQINAPKYVTLVQKQHKLKNDAKMVEDSLLALSKRVAQISSFVNKEIKEINYNMDKGIELLADRRKGEANAKQQYVMTGLNNLALMLDDVLQAMQQQMSSAMPGSQMCMQPKSGKGQQMEQMGKMQQQMNDQLKKLQDQIKKGQSPGKGQMSESLAKLAAQQAAIRKALQELNNSENKDGKKSLGDLDKIAEEMEKSEEDIVNRRITENLIKRQQEIMVRLLEAEKAEKERERSPERESHTADKISKKIPPSLEEYLKKREAEVDLYKTVPPSLKPFYKNLVEQYFKSLSTTN